MSQELDRVAIKKAVNEALERLIWVNSQLGLEPPQAPKITVDLDKAPKKAVVNPLNIIPPDLAQNLEAKQEGLDWVIKPKTFLGKEAFAKISGYVKEQHGEYVRATNNVHGYWRVPL